MMYVDALTRGIDSLPEISDDVRREAYGMLESEGITVLSELRWRNG